MTGSDQTFDNWLGQNGKRIPIPPEGTSVDGVIAFDGQPAIEAR